MITNRELLVNMTIVKHENNCDSYITQTRFL